MSQESIQSAEESTRPVTSSQAEPQEAWIDGAVAEDVTPGAEHPGGSGAPSWLIAGLVIVGIVAVRQGVSMGQLIFQLALPVFFLTQVARRMIAWMRERNRLGRASRRLKTEIDDYGGGFYGVIAMLTFLRLEFQDLQSLWLESTGVWSFVSAFSLERIFDLGVSALFNGVQAAIWPLYWYQEFGWLALAPLAFAFLIYSATVALVGPSMPAAETPIAVEGE